MYTLYDPEKAPIEGYASAPSPMSLPIGLYPMIQNFRWCDGELKVRDGCPAALSSAASAGTLRGWWSGQLGGTEYLLEARRESSETKFYGVNLSTWARSEITNNGVAFPEYGNTRFSTDGPVEFAMLPKGISGLGYDVVIAQNGTDDPRLLDPIGSIGGSSPSNAKAFKILSIDGPGTNNLPSVVFTFRNYVTVSAAGLTESDSTGGITSATAGLAPDVRQDFTITNTVAAGDWANLAFSSKDFQNGAQLVLLVSTTMPSVWDNLRVYLTEGATFNATNTVWDGVTQEYSYAIANADPYGGSHSGKYLIAFSLDKIPNASRNAIINLRLEWVGATAPASSQTLSVYGIFCSGNVPGYAAYALTYRNGASGAESQSYYADSSTSALVRNLGGASLGDMKLPLSEDIYYYVNVNYITPTQAMADAGVNRVLFYRKDPGDDEYRSTGSAVVATVIAGAWNVTSGAQVLATFTDGTLPEDRENLSTATAPRPFHEVMPIGKKMIVVNNRLHVGNLSTGIGDEKISRDGAVLRFSSRLDRSDPYSATRNTYPGSIQGYTKQSAAALGAQAADVEAVYIFTDRERYQLYGLDGFSLSRPRPVDSIGTRSSRSIATREGDILWVDDEMQVRWMSPEGTRNISKGVINDIENVPIGREDDIVGLIKGDRYYLFFTPSGGTTNTRVMVYHLVKRRWEANDLLPGAMTAEGALKVYLADTEPYGILTIGDDRKIYRYEKKGTTTDLGSNIITELEWPRLHKKLKKGFKLGRWRVLCGSASGGSLTAKATYLPDGSSHSATISIASSSSNVFRTYASGAETVSPSGGKAFGIAGQPELTGTLPGATIIYSIEADEEDRDLSASLAD